ncbi:MAG: hypothetical protein AVDCRST_MAG19-686 [uncultured Thermomicrobiales bacterium]|uniref:Uncharacterized protein n=1 Tax=uncultured Thermomicrobiales bacterium TaxID=1645740 RepID=A0A6J4UKH0_9BACT|nr:MAG: hypothetical protein AVDCRST_MAG19-686 [uncultured Thermomicrobiales bacterium]
MLDAEDGLSARLGGREVDRVKRSSLQSRVPARVLAEAKAVDGWGTDGGVEVDRVKTPPRRARLTERAALYLRRMLDHARRAIALAESAYRERLDGDETMRPASPHRVHIVHKVARRGVAREPRRPLRPPWDAHDRQAPRPRHRGRPGGRTEGPGDGRRRSPPP